LNPEHVKTIPFSTRDRILGAAERLFAERGLEGASLRQLTAEAQVNLAAVNYHFGSKDNLIAEVFSRRLDQLGEDRLKALAAAQAGGKATLEDLLRAFVEPALAMTLGDSGGSAFMRVLAHAYAEQNERLRSFLSERYGHVLKTFAEAFAEVLPDLSRETLYWRLDFVAGALVYAMAEFGLIRRRPGISDKAHRERAAEQFIQFAAAGLRAG
jgi:AcrR family transcriptional regulator